MTATMQTNLLINYKLGKAVKSIPIGVPFDVGLPEITMILFIHPWVFQLEKSHCNNPKQNNQLWLGFGVGFAAQQWIELKTRLISKNSKFTEKT